MTTDTLMGRTRYASSGSINFPAFLAWSLLAALVAVALAGFMYWLFSMGQYYIFIVPLICGLMVAGLARAAVAKGHCRNRWVAILLGLSLSVLLYIGSYYIGLVSEFPEAAAQPDVLLRYIRFRNATDVTKDTHTPDNNDQPTRRNKGDVGMNWFRFVGEFGVIIAFVTIAPYKRTRKPYCEQCKRWHIRDTTPFEPEKALPLLESVQSRSARTLAALCSAPPYTTIPNATLAISYCPSLKDGRPQDCPTYLSLKNIVMGPKGATLDTFEQSKGKLVFDNVQLEANELPALVPRFKVLETVTGRAAVTALAPEAPPISVESAERSDTLVEVTPLPSEHNNKVLTRQMILLGNAMAIVVLVGFIGGLALLALGASILEAVEKGTSENKAGGIALCVLGGVGALTAVMCILFDSSAGANRILRNRFNAELKRRSGLFVDPNDPDAVFVEIVPKLNWGKVVLENASDVGLMVVDKGRREIRFEGDRERWRVPAAGLTGADLEFFVHGHGAGATKYYFVTLRSNSKDGFWEAPVRERRSAGVLNARRKQRAQRMAQAVAEIRGARF